jgi:hypothetical protein
MEVCFQVEQWHLVTAAIVGYVLAFVVCLWIMVCVSKSDVDDMDSLVPCVMFSLIWPGVLVVAIIFGVLASFVAIATFGLKKRKRDEGK